MRIVKLLKNLLPKPATILKLFYPLSIILIGVSVYHLVFARRIIPGVYVGNVNVGGMTYSQAKGTLQDYINANIQPLILKYNAYTYSLDPKAISLQYSVDSSVTRAFEVGRTGNIIVDTKEKISGIVKRLQVKAFYEYDDASLNTKFSQIRGELNKPALNTAFELTNSKITLVPAEIGQQVDDQDLYTKVIATFDTINYSPKELLVEEKKPDITDTDVKDHVSQVEKIVFNPLKVTYGDKSWKLEPAQILDLLAFTKEDEKVKLTLNKIKFEAYLDSLGQEVNQLPRGKVTQTDSDKVIKFEITQSGKELDAKKFTGDFKKAVLTAQPGVEISTNDVTTANGTEKYGIFALLGTGKSKFTGSMQARIHNLTLAAERTSGVLVPPGGIYSFNKAVGEISGRTGYDSAYIISNGRTVLGEGGGVCQTSTTLFRAILNAGLPIIARFPHAYRVSYYELESPVGFDASVFQPSLDLQFKNDTPNHVLIQAQANLEENTLEFKIYGTPDGRTTELSEPVVTNVSGPPAPLYQDDPTLAKGVVRQVDFAAGGANVSFTRIVKRNGEVLYQDTFSSRYQPWRAIFLVGTKE